MHSSDQFPLIFNHNNQKNSQYTYGRTNWTTFTLNAIIISFMTEGDINTGNIADYSGKKKSATIKGAAEGLGYILSQTT